MSPHPYHRTVVFVHPAGRTNDRLANRLRSLASQDAIDVLQTVRWADARRSSCPSPVVPVDVLLEDIVRWADVHGADLPFHLDGPPYERVHAEATLPALLAEYWNGTLCYVAPHVDSGQVRGIDEYVATIEQRARRQSHP